MKILIIGLFVLMFNACSILPKPQSVHDFGYANANLPDENTTQNQQTLITVEAPRWLADNRLRYRLLYAIPTQVRFYALDRWIAPPPELFQQLLIASGKHWLMPFIIHIDVFEQQFESTSQAKVVMHFTVTTVPVDTKKQSSTREFHLQQACPTPDARGAVTGFTALTKQAVDKIQVWLMAVN
jgi:cholesterol transport system auxiliary component